MWNEWNELYIVGESYSGSIAVSKTVHGGSNPSSPARRILKSFRDRGFQDFLFSCKSEGISYKIKNNYRRVCPSEAKVLRRNRNMPREENPTKQDSLFSFSIFPAHYPEIKIYYHKRQNGESEIWRKRKMYWKIPVILQA